MTATFGFVDKDTTCLLVSMHSSSVVVLQASLIFLVAANCVMVITSAESNRLMMLLNVLESNESALEGVLCVVADVTFVPLSNDRT
jgi:hypothetical protein